MKGPGGGRRNSAPYQGGSLPDVVIENPVINSPFREPAQHFRFDEDGITSDIADGRRPSSAFVPIAAPKRMGGQQAFVSQWTADRLQPNETVNRFRRGIDLWRQGGHLQVTPTTRRLLDYWSDPERARPLFFCQIEALETAIYITEGAPKFGDDSTPAGRTRPANDPSVEIVLVAAASRETIKFAHDSYFSGDKTLRGLLHKFPA